MSTLLPQLSALDARTQAFPVLTPAQIDRMRACRMYVYRFDSTPFGTQNADAGYYSTRETIVPLSVEPAGDLLELHARAGIELRIVENLWPTIDAILASGLEFSIIRKMNALPRV